MKIEVIDADEMSKSIMLVLAEVDTRLVWKRLQIITAEYYYDLR
jgi:hypothetical protein